MRKMAPCNDTFLYRRRVNPGLPILPEASALHGITDELVADSPEFAAIAPTLLRFLDNCDLEDEPGLNSLATLRTGTAYWIAVSEAVSWTIPTTTPADR